MAKEICYHCGKEFELWEDDADIKWSVSGFKGDEEVQPFCMECSRDFLHIDEDGELEYRPE